MFLFGAANALALPEREFSLTASHWWIGVESMTASAVAAAARHPRPVFCGRLSGENPAGGRLVELDRPGEWHDVALNTAIGQGYLLDLMRQRLPIEHIVLSLPTMWGNPEAPQPSQPLPLDSLLAQTRDVIEGLIVVVRGAEAVMPPGGGGGLTVLCTEVQGAMTPLERGLRAFVGEFVAAESERWRARGLSLALVSENSLS